MRNKAFHQTQLNYYIEGVQLVLVNWARDVYKTVRHAISLFLVYTNTDSGYEP